MFPYKLTVIVFFALHHFSLERFPRNALFWITGEACILKGESSGFADIVYKVWFQGFLVRGTEKVKFPSTEVRTALGGALGKDFWGKDWVSRFGHIEFEVSIIHPSGEE